MDRKPHKGPLPISRNGKLPGIGFGKLTYTNRFSTWLKTRRVRTTYLGEPLTQDQFATLAGISVKVFRTLEQGSSWPNIDTLFKLVDMLQEDPDVVFPKAYALPPDMMFFLTCTKEGQKLITKLRQTMDRLEDSGGFTLLPQVDEKVFKKRYEISLQPQFTYLRDAETDWIEEQIVREGSDGTQQGPASGPR